MLPPRRTLLDLLDERHALTPQQAAFFWDDQPVSFETLWSGANRFAALLLEQGVARGDRGIQARFGGAQRLQRIAHLGLDTLLGFLLLHHDLISLSQRSTEIGSRQAVAKRQRDRHPDTIARIILPKKI